jgi:Kyakuja-Dileera-Zisupton transposase
MDYILLSTLVNVVVISLVVSYDIARQWNINLRSHIAQFPPAMHFNLDNISFTTVIHKFHILRHGKKCQSIWSLNYHHWMGRTDGEGVECEWSHINPVAMSTKVMGPGAHHDTLDDHWGAWNWRKIVSMGVCSTYIVSLAVVDLIMFLGHHLETKLKEAIPMSHKHCALLNALLVTFPAETVTEWTHMVEDWQEDTSRPNPFEETALGMFY